MLIASALRQALKDGYTLKTFKSDAMAGFAVSLVALPLAMALSVAVGLPPQHGLYTAIIAGIVAAILGGSSTQVSGPTAAFIVIVAPIVADFGLQGLVWCQLLAGLWMILLGSFRMGRYIGYMPYPVTTGFTAGIAIVIATIAMNDFLGLDVEGLKGSYIEKLQMLTDRLPALNIYEAGIGVVTLLGIIYLQKLSKLVPSTILGIMLGTALSYVLIRNGAEVATLESRFTFMLPDSSTGHGIPPYPPSLHIPDMPLWDNFKHYIVPSFVIAALGALESLLSATVADSMAGTKHNPNAELNGIGIGTIASGIFGGIPATGAIARTAANITSGAKTPMASVIHGLLILVYMMLFAPIIGHIPMACLAAVLIVVAWRMSHLPHFIRIARRGHWTDKLVLLACFSLTIIFDMVVGVLGGLALAIILHWRDIKLHRAISISDAEYRTRMFDIERPDLDMLVLNIHAPLYFGTVTRLLENLHHTEDQTKKIVINLGKLTHLDFSGAMGIENLVKTLIKQGKEIHFKGSTPLIDTLRHLVHDHVSTHIKHKKD